MRVDVPAMKSIESGISNDFDELLNALVTGENNSYVIRGFNVNMTGAIGSAASGLQMLVEDSAILHGSSNESGTFFVVPSGTAPQILNSVTNTRVIGSFTPGAQNYISLEFVRQVDDTTTGQVYIWNPANKNETTKTIPLAITMDYNLVIGTTQPASNSLPMALVTTDLSNNVVDITNIKPNLLGLGRGGASPDPTYSYPWTDGREPNALTSSNSLIDPFKGGDLQLQNLKEWMDAVMSRFKEIFGTPYWTSANASGSLASLRQDLANTIFTGRGTVTHSDTVAGQINWSNDLSAVVIGSDIKYVITANPATTDITLADNDVAYITLVRDEDITPNLIFTNASQVVTSVGAIPWTSGLQAGDFVKTATASAALYYEILTVDSPTQVTLVEAYAETDTGAVGVQSQYAFGGYETNPSPSTDRHIKVAQRDQVPFGENIYWVLLRQDNGGSVPRVYARFIGKELEQGETQDINDGTPQAVLDYIGSFSESDSGPDYGQAYTPLVAEVSTITAVAASDITSGQRFSLNASNDIEQYYGWFNKDAAGGDPTPSGLTGIEIPVTTGDNQLVVAAAIQAAVDAISDFNAVDNLNGTVTITNDDAGATTNAANVDVGGAFAIAIDVEGTGDRNRYVIDEENLTKGIKTLDKALGLLQDAIDDLPWKGTAINFAALPSSGNSDGDVRLVLDTRVAYHWDASQSLWLPLTGGSGLKLIGGGTVSLTKVKELVGTIEQLVNTASINNPNQNNFTAQTFTPAVDTTVSAVELLFWGAGSAPVGTVTCEIWGTDGSSEPDETNILATSTPLDVTGIPDFVDDIRQFTLTAPITLTAGTTYAIVSNTDNMTGGFIRYRGSTANPYAGGSVFAQSSPPTGAWSNPGGGAYDLWFRILEEQDAQEVIYNSPNASPDQFFAPNNNYRMGQNFIPPESGNLTSASLFLAGSGFSGSGSIKAELYDTSGNNPNTLIATSTNTVDPTTLPSHPSASGFLFNFPATALVGLTKYSIVVNLEDVVFTGGSIGVYHNTANPVATTGVGRVSSTNGGGSWSFTSAHDLIGTISIESKGVSINFDADMFLEKAGLLYSANTIPTSESPIALLSDKDVAYVEPNLIAPGGNLAVVLDTLDNVPPTAVIIGRNDGGEAIVGSSSTRLKVGESIKLYDTITDQARNKVYGHKSGFFRSDEPIVWTGSEIQHTTDIIFETLKDDGTEQAYTITAPAPAALPNIEQTAQLAYGLAFIANNHIAQTFTVPGGQDFDILTSAFKMRSQGATTGTFTAEIWGVDGGGLPDSSNVVGTATASYDATTLPTTPTAGVDATFNFSGVTLTAGTQYAFVLNGSALGGSNIEIGTANSDVLPSEELAFAASPGTTGSWSTDNEDAYFVITGQSAAASPTALADGEYAYVTIDRTQDAQAIEFTVGTAPAEAAPGSEVVIFGKRKDVSGAGYLHLPFNKQVLEPGQSVLIGAAGSGGSGTILTADVKRRLSFSPYCYATANEIALDTDSKINTVDSTGAYSPADKAFKFSSIGETLVSNELLDADFWSQGKDITEAEAMFRYVLASYDDSSTFELSRDGGNEYQAFVPTRIGATDTLSGKHEFAEEASFAHSFNNGATDGSITLTDDAGLNPLESGSFTLTATTTLKQIPLNVTKSGTALGNYRIQVVKDDGGNPSTDTADLLFESSAKNIALLSAGANATVLDFTLTLVAGIYHVVIVTDTEYKDTYTANNANNIAVEATGTDLTTVVNGRELSLLLRVTAGTANTLSQGYGVFYDNSYGSTDITLKKQINKFYFSSDDNKVLFNLNFLPDPDILVAYDPFRGQTYVAADGVFRIEGNSVIFEAGTFATDPTTGAEDILIIFRQIVGNGFDNSDQNANKIASIESQLIDIGDQLESVSDSMVVPKIAAPFTTVQSRSLMPDLSMDLKPRLGIERIMTQSVSKIQDEIGPNGGAVYGLVNDKFDQIRFVGDIDSRNDSSGVYIAINNTDGTGFVEVTFYGTGLNLLYYWNGVRDQRVSVDGGAETTINPNTSGLLNARNYTPNTSVNVASGLTLGTHTVKIRNNNGAGQGVLGFEILNEEVNGNILTNPGAQLFKGKRLVNSTQDSTSYNSDFESGTLTTYGGHVLMYQKSDGSVAKAVNSSDDTLGTELITNGTFDSDITGWTKTGGSPGTITHSATFGGSLRYNDTGAGYLQANAFFATVPGIMYEISVDIKSISANQLAALVGDAGEALDGNGFIGIPGRWGGLGLGGAPKDNIRFSFVAQGTSARIQIYEGNSSVNVTDAFVDNVSVKEVPAKVLASADHSNEEIIRRVTYKEFGAGQSTADFSSPLPTNAGQGPRAFTLDDGTMTLLSDNVAVFNRGIYPKDPSDIITFTFVGTGLDLISVSDNASTAWDYDIHVDGVKIGSPDPSYWNNFEGTNKIVSGLPYGTHTVRLQTITASGTAPVFRDFIIYGPKTPTLPSGAKAVSDYFIMADFREAYSQGLLTVSRGALRKDISREMLYVEGTGGANNWGLSFVPSAIIGGYQAFSDRQDAYMEYTFFGTGFDLRWAADTGRTASVDVTLNGIAASAANYPTAEYFEYGGTTARWNTGLGSLSMIDTGPNLGVGAGISNLPLGTYTVRFSNNNAGSFIVPEALDIITPIHAPKQNGPFTIQGALEVGSQGIRDLRKFSSKDIPVANMSGAGYTQMLDSLTTLSAGQVKPIGSPMSIVLEEDSYVNFTYNVEYRSTGADSADDFTVYLNGKAFGLRTIDQSHSANRSIQRFISERLFLRKGSYTAHLEVASGSAVSFTYNATRHKMTYKVEKK